MTAKTMQAFFITHDTSNYDASRSQQLLLSSYDGIELILLCRIFFHGMTRWRNEALRG